MAEKELKNIRRGAAAAPPDELHPIASSCASEEIIHERTQEEEEAGAEAEAEAEAKEEELNKDRRRRNNIGEPGQSHTNNSETPLRSPLVPDPSRHSSCAGGAIDNDHRSAQQSTLADPARYQPISPFFDTVLSKSDPNTNLIAATANKPGAVSISMNSKIHGGEIPTKVGLEAPMPPMIPDFCQNHHHANSQKVPPPPSYSPISYTPGCVIEENYTKTTTDHGKATKHYHAPSTVVPPEKKKKQDDDDKPSYMAYLDDNDDGENGGDDQSLQQPRAEILSGETTAATTTPIGACPVAGPGVPMSQTSFIIGSSTPSNIYSMGRSSKSSFKYRQRSSMLVEARPVVSTQQINAQPVDDQILEAREARDKGYKRLACCLVVFVCLVLTVSVAFLLSNSSSSSSIVEEWNDSTNATATPYPTSAPITLPPGMVNLELLYLDLPETTRDNIFLRGTPQNRAWEWLLGHPNATNLAEWRKKQVFALSTLYYSLGGPSWPESVRSGWLNFNTSACHWVFDEDDVAYWFQQSRNYLGPGAYQREDFSSCNEDGELQTIILPGLRHPKPSANSGNVVPPEIGLLTSLRIFIIAWGQTDAKVSEVLVPELMELPRLGILAFHDSGLTGTIPNEIGKISTLRHLVLGANKLTGSLPLGLTNMSSLEHVILEDTDLTGSLPSQIGLLTSLTKLEIAKSSFTGPIPSELGLLDRLKVFRCYENKLSSSLPTQMGLITNMRTMFIRDNSFVGQIPSQLGLMTRAFDFMLGNTLEVKHSTYYNNFSGPLPDELWKLSRMKRLSLSNLPHLSGRVPTQIVMPNLTTVSLNGSPRLSGTLPDQACIFVDELHFDCSNLLCGCDCGCKVIGHGNTTSESFNHHQDFQDEQQEEQWPGLLPSSPINGFNAITINIWAATDRYHHSAGETTTFEWSSRNESGMWSIMDTEILEQEPEQKVHTYRKEVQSSSVYRLVLFGGKGGGNGSSCCWNTTGVSLLTITNSTPSINHKEGTVLWEAAPGSLVLEEGSSFHLYLWVDSDGSAKVLEHLTGPRI